MSGTLRNAVPAGFELDDDEIDHLTPILKIVRLDDITTGAGLNGCDFDATLDEEYQKYFMSFREQWNTHSKNKSPYLRQDLRCALLRNEKPLLLALKMFANCPDSTNVKYKSLSYFVLDTVCKLHEEIPNLKNNCDENTSMIAFNFIKTTGLISLNNAMIDAYRLLDIRQLLLPKLREMLDEGFYKEASQWIIKLQLTDEFDMMELAFPLMAQEKLPLAEEYLDIAIDQRLPFVIFLDSLLHKNKSVIEMCENILNNYKNLRVAHNVLSYRPIAKIVSRLAKKYNFDDSNTPNYKFTKTCAYLRHLHREYEKSRIGLEAFRELVQELAYNYEIRTDFVNYMAGASALNEAAFWYKTFKLQPNDCPEELKSFVSSSGIDETVISGSSTSDSAQACDVYLTMDLPEDDLIIVDTSKKFDSMLYQLSNENVIYIDSEWKQHVCFETQLCLLQIATSHNVYLIDCLAEQELNVNHWRRLGAIFNNVNILKVGFSITNDLQMLHRSLPLQLRLNMPQHYLDLRTLWILLKKQRQNTELPCGNLSRSGEALSDLSLLCLGKKLNKSNQCSNWANRPMRHDQILYAALDARCLHLIYRILLDHVPNIKKFIDKSIATNNFLKRGGQPK